MRHFIVYGVLALRCVCMGYAEATNQICNAITGRAAKGMDAAPVVIKAVIYLAMLVYLGQRVQYPG